MAQKQHSQCDEDDEVVSPEEADRKGKVKIVKGIVEDPEVQGVIKGALVRETVKTSILMACIFVGILKLYDVAKVVTGFDWKGDFIIGLVLTLVGLIYMLRDMSSGTRKWSRNDK
jgi:hypothetical protein